MDGADVLTGVVVGAALGGALGWFLSRVRHLGALAAAQAIAAACQGRAESAETQLSGVRSELSAAQAACAAAQATCDAEKSRSAEKLALVEHAQEKLREAFAALSADALRSNNEAFVALAEAKLAAFQQGARGDLEARQKAIGELLEPVRASLTRVDCTLQTIEKDRAQAYGSLSQYLTSMSKVQSELHGETRRLVNALRAPHVRGAWGEMQLKRVVEMAGMLDHCDFDVQPSSEDGRLRPDLVVRLPGDKIVVVDAKAPLAAYLDVLEIDDEARREQRLADHARQVRAHMERLGSKAYWAELDGTPEFVVMFLPGEAFFSAALQKDPSLIEFGVAQHVIPASPVTLIALLRAVAYGWNQERIAESAQKISDLGQELYERLSLVGAHLQRVGSGLETAVGAYNDAVGSIESRFLVTVRKFRDLGVPSSRALPELEPVEKVTRELSGTELLGVAPSKTLPSTTGPVGLVRSKS